MLRSWIALTVAALAALPVLSARPAAALHRADNPLTIRWHGQSFFEVISSKGTRIVFDPHAIEAYGRISVPADLVLMSHLHSDHVQTGVISNLKQAKQFNALRVEKREGGSVQEWNVLKEEFKDVKFYTVGTYHDDMGGLMRGKNGVFVVEVDGLRVVHLGDLGHTLSEAQKRRIGAVDVLMIPVGGVYTLNGLDAYKVVQQLEPRRYIIPMHCGTDVYTDLLPPKVFLDEFKDDGKADWVKTYKTNELLIDPKAPAPAHPTVAVLNWTGSE
jgi:L-ascorbate metabolism protein UlaG (beta-lactamase superfamily)